MKMSVVVLLLFISLAFASPRGFTDPAGQCIPANCLLSHGCVCSSTVSPIATELTPQFVTFTFDDSVQDTLYVNYYEPLLFNRLNPDGNPISTTFYVPHQYTDYVRVNNLYNAGFEIADHSVSKNSLNDYWANADVSTLLGEFGDQLQIISQFANIPVNAITGVRTPQLWLAGNTSFEAYSLAGFHYDNTWTTPSTEPYFPYTLDYLSKQKCAIGKCPNAAFPGFWVLPLINLKNAAGAECNALFACGVGGTTQDIANWLIAQYQRVATGNRAPMTFLVSASWFAVYDPTGDALRIFLDYLGTLSDTFIVSHREVLNWAKSPRPLGLFSTLPKVPQQGCSPQVCPLQFGVEIRYMSSCVTCPELYPWLGNPLGIVPTTPPPTTLPPMTTPPMMTTPPPTPPPMI